MKKEKLIEELQKMPDGIEVCVFDWRKNLHDDCGDGSSVGVYPKFELELVDLLSPDEYEFHKEKNGKDFIPWVGLNIENDDYDDSGKLQV